MLLLTEGSTDDPLTPRRIVEELDRYVVGQGAAKRAVAVALRNRLRRRRLAPELRREVTPKNILLVGPTGVGKTEIARRLARLVRAPFVKVEATKFTEVGYVGRDVESIIRDLVENAINLVKAERATVLKDRASAAAEERLLDILLPPPPGVKVPNRAADGKDGVVEGSTFSTDDGASDTPEQRYLRSREKMRARIRSGRMDEQEVELPPSVASPGAGSEGGPNVFALGPFPQGGGPGAGPGMGGGAGDIGSFLSNLMGGSRQKRRVPLRRALEILTQESVDELLDMDKVREEALERTQEDGIVFLDEIDKVCSREGRQSSGEVSREGVQRDLLPIVEGSVVQTRHGSVATDHILFIAAGAFHVVKPTDLIPELQGRFPLRVELESLTVDDFVRILSEPEGSLARQYEALLATDGTDVVFPEEGLRAIAEAAHEANERLGNIGARRLHTVIEKVLEDLSFHAGDAGPMRVVIDAAFVRSQIGPILESDDLTRFVL